MYKWIKKGVIYMCIIVDYLVFWKEGNLFIYNDKDEFNEYYVKNNILDI